MTSLSASVDLVEAFSGARLPGIGRSYALLGDGRLGGCDSRGPMVPVVALLLEAVGELAAALLDDAARRRRRARSRA